MLSYIEVGLKDLRRLFSRSNWAISLLRLAKFTRPRNSPGLVMVQIDGLSLTQINRALKKNRMPFLNRLINQECCTLKSFYSGLPSNTPAVQGELMYGIKSCVPSFYFLDRELGKPVKMMDTSYVHHFENKLRQQGGPGLLKDGSSYSNIFTGDATEAHFCWSKMGWDGVLQAINPFIFPLLVILYIDIFIRTFALLVIEFLLSCIDCVRGTIKGKNFSKEFEFIGIRVLVCVFLRELIVTGACMDIARGLPIIHLNFLGYDEQAHHRGPSSRYAHWTLQGIDDAICRINHAIKQSAYQSYDLWIYSDHGQETTATYPLLYGVRVEDAIEELFSQNAPDFLSSSFYEKNFINSRAQLLMGTKHQHSNKYNQTPIDFNGRSTIVTAMGPLGQIYLSKKLTQKETDAFARLLVSEIKIPLVMVRQGENHVHAYTPKGTFILPDQITEILGDDHLFLNDMKEDLLRICHHPDAGEFIIAGWSVGEKSISFPLESGGHAGMGTDETHGFALLPMDAPLRLKQKTYLRPIDLRETAQRFLKQDIFGSVPVKAEDPTSCTKLFSIMSYNVHGCKGMDGHFSTDRIARVIARYNPDIVCLQELDHSRERSNKIDQAEIIARRLEMHYHFHPTFRKKDGLHGNAILSRYPITLMKVGELPRKANKIYYEARAAIWVVATIGDKKVNIINTHLSLWPQERLLQIDALLGKEWISHPDCQGPVIFCGDFNAYSGSVVHQRVCEKLKDSQINGKKYGRGTYIGRLPMWQLDHIFISHDAQIQSVLVPQTFLEKIASDHLPIISTIQFCDTNKSDNLKE